MRVLALDYGSARCGCAVSDPTGTLEAMYSPRMWPALTEGLKALRAGDGAPLLALADTYYDGADDDAHTAIGCVDDDRTTDRAVAGETARRAVAAAPFLDSAVEAFFV